MTIQVSKSNLLKGISVNNENDVMGFNGNLGSRTTRRRSRVCFLLPLPVPGQGHFTEPNSLRFFHKRYPFAPPLRAAMRLRPESWTTSSVSQEAAPQPWIEYFGAPYNNG